MGAESIQRLKIAYSTISASIGSWLRSAFRRSPNSLRATRCARVFNLGPPGDLLERENGLLARQDLHF
jgi:hypothetical protein